MSDVTQQPPYAGVPVCYRHPDREAHIRCQRCNRPICPDCMRNASVGFQCPECVAEGRRTTRQVKRGTALRVGFRGAPVTYTLMGICVVVWGLINLTGRYASSLYLAFAQSSTGSCSISGTSSIYPNATSRGLCAQLSGFNGHATHWAPGVSDGAPWQLLTTIFTHVEIWHIAVNMFSLYILGTQLEPVLGRARYLTLFLLSGLAGSAGVYWLANPHESAVGASGAIFGLMGTFAVLLLRARASLQPLLWTLVINFAITFAVPGIAWQAHVGGFICGAAVGGVLVYSGGVRRRPYQVGGLIGIGVVVALAIVTRSVMLA